MKVIDLDGTVSHWKLTGEVVRGRDSRKRSQLHLKARALLKELYPALQIIEEIPIQLKRSQRASLDFYINTIKTVIEVHGEQHYKFNTFYHSSRQDFINQKKRDNDLKEWCEINNMTYVELPFDEGEEQWKSRITHPSD